METPLLGPPVFADGDFAGGGADTRMDRTRQISTPDPTDRTSNGVAIIMAPLNHSSAF